MGNYLTKLSNCINDKESNNSILDIIDIVREAIGEYNTSQNNPHHVGDVVAHTAMVVNYLNIIEKRDNIETPSYMLLAALYHDAGKSAVKTTDPETKIDHFIGHANESVKILESLRSKYSEISDEDFEKALELIRLHDTKYSKVSKIKNMIEVHYDGFAEDLFKLQWADIEGQSQSTYRKTFNTLYEFALKISNVKSYTCIDTFVDKCKQRIADNRYPFDTIKEDGMP